MRLTREQADAVWRLAYEAGEGTDRLTAIFPSMRRNWEARVRLAEKRRNKTPRTPSPPFLGEIVSDAMERAFTRHATHNVFNSTALFRILERR